MPLTILSLAIGLLCSTAIYILFDRHFPTLEEEKAPPYVKAHSKSVRRFWSLAALLASLIVSLSLSAAVYAADRASSDRAKQLARLDAQNSSIVHVRNTVSSTNDLVAAISQYLGPLHAPSRFFEAWGRVAAEKAINNLADSSIVLSLNAARDAIPHLLSCEPAYVIASDAVAGSYFMLDEEYLAGISRAAKANGVPVIRFLVAKCDECYVSSQSDEAENQLRAACDCIARSERIHSASGAIATFVVLAAEDDQIAPRDMMLTENGFLAETRYSRGGIPVEVQGTTLPKSVRSAHQHFEALHNRCMSDPDIYVALYTQDISLVTNVILKGRERAPRPSGSPSEPQPFDGEGKISVSQGEQPPSTVEEARQAAERIASSIIGRLDANYDRPSAHTIKINSTR